MTDLVVELLAMLVYGNAIVLLHEAGHAAFARVGGFRVTSFAVGLGPPLLRLPLPGGVVLHLDRWWLGGSCTAIPLGPAASRRAWYHAGGLLVQGVLAVVLLTLPDTWLVQRVASFNLLVAATNAIPWRLGRSASDGWYLLDAARGGRRGTEILPQRPRLLRLAEREQAIGSRLGTLYAELCLAWADILAGRPDRADAFFEADPPETVLEPWVDVLYTHVRSAWHLAHGRPLPALRTARDGRAAREGDLGETALDLLTVAEARALVALGSLEPAVRLLASLAGTGGPIGRQGAAVHLRAVLDGPVDAVEEATWRVGRRHAEAWLDPVEVVDVLRQAARRLDAAERPVPARGALHAARALAARVLATAAPGDRPSLEARLASPHPPDGDALDSASDRP